MIPAATPMIIRVQSIFSSFFTSVLGLKTVARGSRAQLETSDK
jgi:hypothetical protein